MREIPLDDVAALVAGAVSIRISNGYLRPWRLPVDDMELHDPGLMWMASMPAGIRLRLKTDSRSIRLQVAHVVLDGSPEPKARYDLVAADSVVDTRTAQGRDADITFDNLPGDETPVEVWLPQAVGVRIRAVSIDDGATISPAPDDRPRWVTYGSSITHCMDSPGPTETWPALAARQLGWQLTCLGFAGMCHLDPLVARTMARLPADHLTIKLGINVHNMASLRQRTFAPLVHGFVATLRERHPITPLTVISPVISPEREGTPTTSTETGAVIGDLTLDQMREALVSVVDVLRKRGDDAIDYLDGRELFGEHDVDHLPDGLHPDQEGNRRIAARLGAHFGAP